MSYCKTISTTWPPIMNKTMTHIPPAFPRLQCHQSTPRGLPPLKERTAVSMVYYLGVSDKWIFNCLSEHNLDPSQELFWPVSHQTFFEKACEQVGTDKYPRISGNVHLKFLEIDHM